MKQIPLFFKLIFCLTSFGGFGQKISYDTIQYAKEYHQQRLAIFKNEPFTKGKTIFLGNSITEFGNWKEILQDSSVVNRGIAGDNTFGVLARLDDVFTRQPNKLFIEIGINDLSQEIPVQIVLKNIFKIVGKIQTNSPATEIYIFSILPPNDNVKVEYHDAFNKGGQIELVNEQVSKNARHYKYTYIDLTKKLTDKHGKLYTKYAQSDGLHLNENGYKVWAEILKAKKYISCGNGSRPFEGRLP
jgi:lysophospholipase L1-like esterase